MKIEHVSIIGSNEAQNGQELRNTSPHWNLFPEIKSTVKSGNIKTSKKWRPSQEKHNSPKIPETLKLDFEEQDGSTPRITLSWESRLVAVEKSLRTIAALNRPNSWDTSVSFGSIFALGRRSRAERLLLFPLSISSWSCLLCFADKKGRSCSGWTRRSDGLGSILTP